MAADFTIADVIEWARTKPPSERYDFGNSGNCVIAQFGKATGRGCLLNLGPARLLYTVGHDLYSAAIGNCTFGGFVKALEKRVEPNPFKRLLTRLSGEQVSA
jgi:hypothetical protein